jgi:hypothetical protein
VLISLVGAADFISWAPWLLQITACGPDEKQIVETRKKQASHGERFSPKTQPTSALGVTALRQPGGLMMLGNLKHPS